jgi:hypothetical protein
LDFEGLSKPMAPGWRFGRIDHVTTALSDSKCDKNDLKEHEFKSFKRFAIMRPPGMVLAKTCHCVLGTLI